MVSLTTAVQSRSVCIVISGLGCTTIKGQTSSSSCPSSAPQPSSLTLGSRATRPPWDCRRRRRFVADFVCVSVFFFLLYFTLPDRTLNRWPTTLRTYALRKRVGGYFIYANHVMLNRTLTTIHTKHVSSSCASRSGWIRPRRFLRVTSLETQTAAATPLKNCSAQLGHQALRAQAGQIAPSSSSVSSLAVKITALSPLPCPCPCPMSMHTEWVVKQSESRRKLARWSSWGKETPKAEKESLSFFLSPSRSSNSSRFRRDGEREQRHKLLLSLRSNKTSPRLRLGPARHSWTN